MQLAFLVCHQPRSSPVAAATSSLECGDVRIPRTEQFLIREASVTSVLIVGSLEHVKMF